MSGAAHQSFRCLLNEVRSGSEHAFRQLLERYGGYVIRAIRRKLSQKLRSRFDSNDFAQSVWIDIHRQRERLDECASPEMFVSLLVTIANRKVMYEFRRHVDSQKLDVNRESAVDVNAYRSELSDSRVKSPSDVAMARERWGRLVDGQPDLYRRIMRLRMAGATIHEVATQTGVNERTVRRVIQRLAATSDVVS